MPVVKSTDKRLSEEEMLELMAPFAKKLAWFMQNGYQPHYFQLLFHCMATDQRITRFRHLVAGRRGGKTLSAIWEVLYYVLHPEEYWLHFHGVESSKPLWVWVLAKDYKVGNAARLGFREACKDVLKYGDDYREHKGERFFEFTNDSLVEFKTADDPQNLRGAGLHMLWIDEAAFIPDDTAWGVVSPALSDKQGALITTTTPDGKNWYYDEWWTGAAVLDEKVGRVEYTSLDNHYFPPEEWKYQLGRMHPMQFKREFMASFDSMAGKDLAGDWLTYYDKKELEGKRLFTYMGVDPAISQSDRADMFAMSLIGVEEHTNDVYLLELLVGRYPFPDQIQLIQEWHLKYRPQLIGIEATAYQASLEQQVSRLASMPPTMAVTAKGKKSERILSMAPVFRIGKVRIRKDHGAFIEQWVDYDSNLKNPKDDALDAVEIALRTAGVLLPEMYEVKAAKYDNSIDAIVRRSIPQNRVKGVDEVLGEDW
jgi:predicted phage terminase large subunit-like protein